MDGSEAAECSKWSGLSATTSKTNDANHVCVCVRGTVCMCVCVSVFGCMSAWETESERTSFSPLHWCLGGPSFQGTLSSQHPLLPIFRPLQAFQGTLTRLKQRSNQRMNEPIPLAFVYVSFPLHVFFGSNGMKPPELRCSMERFPLFVYRGFQMLHLEMLNCLGGFVYSILTMCSWVW